jgi:hypothetical protein
MAINYLARTIKVAHAEAKRAYIYAIQQASQGTRNDVDSLKGDVQKDAKHVILTHQKRMHTEQW